MKLPKGWKRVDALVLTDRPALRPAGRGDTDTMKDTPIPGLMLRRCGTCLWARQDPDYYWPELECRRMATDRGRPRHRRTIAMALDAENYAAWLRVEPNFGCIMWRLRPRALRAQIKPGETPTP